MNPTFVLILTLCFSVSAFAQSSEEFLSWYNGWGTHSVWGAGAVQASYRNATVQCGGKQVPVAPIYDSHSNDGPPKENQTRAYAEVKNRALLSKFEQQGVACSFTNEVKGGT